MKPNISQLRTVDGETLMSQPLRPPDFVVSGLLSKGLHILAGSPKVGKSWLALWLAVTVAKGEPVWGMNTQQGTTLYLCLEDSVLRIQNRLFEITEDAPPNVPHDLERRLSMDKSGNSVSSLQSAGRIYQRIPSGYAGKRLDCYHAPACRLLCI